MNLSVSQSKITISINNQTDDLGDKFKSAQTGQFVRRMQYVLDDKHDVGIIEVSKIDGTLLRAEEIKSGKNQMILDLKNLPNGMYIVSLKSNTRNIQSERLIKGGY